MSLSILRKLLEQQLATITPPIETQWENSPYTPKDNVPYQQVFLMLANPLNPELSGSFFQDRGYLQINLRYPIAQGPGDADVRAQLIRDAFPFPLSLSANGITVTVKSTPTRLPGAQDGSRYQVPVRVYFTANSNG